MKIVMDAMKEGDGRSEMESMERGGVGRIVTSRRRKSCEPKLKKMLKALPTVKKF